MCTAQQGWTRTAPPSRPKALLKVSLSTPCCNFVSRWHCTHAVSVSHAATLWGTVTCPDMKTPQQGCPRTAPPNSPVHPCSVHGSVATFLCVLCAAGRVPPRNFCQSRSHWHASSACQSPVCDSNTATGAPCITTNSTPTAATKHSCSRN